ncbi:riboflavin kinase, partial [Xylographa trunciseda]|nr:riboflavin kinase [Xylographa trunciseda]
LGIPTANIPIAGLTVGGHADLASGVYYGFVGLNVTADGTIVSAAAEPTPSSSSSSTTTSTSHEPPSSSTVPHPSASTTTTFTTYPAVLSIGYNPFYKNTVRSVEVHVLHGFAHDFYGAHMNLLVLGFVRPEYDYVSKEALVADIWEDVAVARRSLAREAYARWRGEGWLVGWGEGEGDVGS